MPFVVEAYDIIKQSRIHDSLNNQITDNIEPLWLQKVCRLDSICHATIIIPSARKSSISQGRCMLKVCSEIFDDEVGRDIYSSLMQRLSTFDDFVSSSSGRQVIHRGSISGFSTGSSSDGVKCGVNSSKIQLVERNHQPSSSNDHNDTSTKSIYRGHYAPYFGIVCGVLGLSKDLTRTMFLRCMMRDALSAACRLNILGPLQAAKLQLYFSHILPTMIPTSTSALDPSDIGNSVTDELDNENNNKRKRQNEGIGEDNKEITNQTPVNTNSSPAILNTHLDTSILTHQRHWEAEDASLSYLSPRAAAVMMKRRALQLEFPSATSSAATAPVLDLIQSQHDQLYSRLFIS